MFIFCHGKEFYQGLGKKNEQIRYHEDTGSLFVGSQPFFGASPINFNSRCGTIPFSAPVEFQRAWALASSGLYVILVPDVSFTPYALRPIYFGEAMNLSRAVTKSHEHYSDWTETADALYVAYHPKPGSTVDQRVGLEQALRDCYQPECNATTYNLDRLPSPPVTNLQAGLGSLLSQWSNVPLRTCSLFISHAWDYNEEYYQLEELLKGRSNFSWRNSSIPQHAAIKSAVSFPKSYLRLIRELSERISQADCVLVLSGMYCSHSEWIQTELELAAEAKKPIIGIKPRGQQKIPGPVQRAAAELVGWNTDSIISAIERRAPAPRSVLADLANHYKPSGGSSLSSALAAYLPPK